MPDCYQIKKPEELTEYLKMQGRDAFDDFDYQLQTNYGFVHELPNGQVAFFDCHFNHKAILFDTKKCFDDVITPSRSSNRAALGQTEKSANRVLLPSQSLATS